MRDVEQSMFPDLRSDKAVGPLPGSVLAGTNADLMYSIRRLYLNGKVLDVTYGKGSWWRTYQPGHFTSHDINLDGIDFTDLPYPDRSYNTVCYDPPYIPAGGDATTTAGSFQSRYGINGGRSQDTLEHLIMAGLEETARVAADYLLVKCMDYVNGGVFTPMSMRLWRHADQLGLNLHDEIIHHAGSGPGGHNIITPKRARRHHSKLLVFTWDQR